MSTLRTSEALLCFHGLFTVNKHFIRAHKLYSIGKIFNPWHISILQWNIYVFLFGSEFCKRLDPDLPFYYWRGTDRYTEEEMPSFDETPELPVDLTLENHPLRLHRVKPCRREDGTVFVAGRCFLPASGRGSIRQRLHNPVVALPPIPGQQGQ